MTILSLCDYSGVWSQPYVDAGYEVIRVDIKHPSGFKKINHNLWYLGCDILKTDFNQDFYGVLAAPPCTCLCRAGARWWPRMDAEGRTQIDVELLRACLDICRRATVWDALEQPPGRHRRLIPELGPPTWQYQPWEYGDAWNKQTYIWGRARKPAPDNIVTPEPTIRAPSGHTQGRIARISSSWKAVREQTPEGFAGAFFKANP